MSDSTAPPTAAPTEDIPQATILRLCSNNEWGQADSILRTLSKGADEVNYTKEDGVTPLMLSCKENKLVAVERLCELGADINSLDQNGRSALHYAANYAKDDVVKSLLSKKADVTVSEGIDGKLPLHLACSRGLSSLGMVQQILKNSPKESLVAQDKSGAIPLFAAAESASLATCKELLRQNPEGQVTTSLTTTGDTIIHLAAQKQDIELAKLVCEHGASVNAQNNSGLAPLHISAALGDDVMIRHLHNNQADPNIYDQHHRTALHVAAECGHTHIVELLVEKVKADPLARTKDGSTLLHVASESGFPDTAMALLKKGVPLMMPNKSGAICLHSAAQHGHISVVRALLSKGATVDAKTKDHYTALHIAVEACQPLVIQTLLGYGANVELKGGKCKETPLHIAARVTGAEQCVDMLIRCGADVDNFKENGETALHIASRHGHLEVVKSLLAENSDPTLPAKSGETPLHLAVRYCHWDVCDELLRFVSSTKSKFDATILVNLATAEGETSLHLAAELLKSQIHHDFEDTDIIKLLLEYGGDPNVGCKLTMETPMHYCARAGNSDILQEAVMHIEPSKVQITLNKQARNGWSPLLAASREGHLEIVKILLQHHARVDVFDEHGKAALHLAAECGNLEVADVLLMHKAFVNAKSKIGLTPLHLAAQNGFTDLVKLLVNDHAASVDALSLAKKTPLHMAAETGQKGVCATLLGMNADANATDEDGQTPLHLAAENDHSGVIKLFLKHDTNLVTKANTKGMTYAHIAAAKGSVGVIKELMKFNKSMICTAKNSTNASTSLHLATEGGHHEVVRVLLASGANPLEENADGMTPLHLAAKHGYVEVLDVLKDHLELTTSSSKSGFTALHVAAHFGQTNTVRELLNKLSATVTSVMARDGIGGGEKPRKTSKFKLAATKALVEFGIEHPHGLTPLHLAAQSGHQGLVRVLLNSPGVQVDAATAVHGSIPLHLAAQNGHTAVVSLLLSKDTNLIHVVDKRGMTGLHLASKSGQLDMVALLLGQGAEINALDESGWAAIHYASKAGHLEVVKLLADGGASTVLETKDNKTAICYAAAATHVEVLSYLMKKDHNTTSLMNDKRFVFDLMVCGRLNDQKSIQEFINLSPAPCETASKMSRNFLDVSSKEKERAKELIAASQFCEQMATDLMAIAASMNTPRTLLTSVDRNGSPFLDILIDCAQKEVVAHPTIQKYLSDVWMGGIRWKTWKIFLLFTSFLVCPPVWIAFSLPLKHKYCRVPIFKFMSYLVSHMLFILLLILVAAVPLSKIEEAKNLFPTVTEWLLLFWFAGLLVAELTNPGDNGGLGIIKSLIIVLGALAVISQLVGLSFAPLSKEMFTCLYIRNQFLGIAISLCFVQFLDFLSFHHLFGPWAIIIGSLVVDVVKFFVILGVFMCGFTLQIAAIYQPVYPLEPVGSSKVGDAGAIHLGFVDIFELLFFSLFGLVDPENLPPINSSPTWSREVVKGVFGLYLLISTIVLINLLIAMMSDTYQRIQAQSDTEWKFGRAKLIRNMNKTSSTPSPINLLAKLFIYIKVLVRHRGKVCSAAGQQYINEEEGLNTLGVEANTDQMHNSQGFLSSTRNTQVAPNDNTTPAGPERIDRVIDWESVVRKYYINQGASTGDDAEDLNVETN